MKHIFQSAPRSNGEANEVKTLHTVEYTQLSIRASLQRVLSGIMFDC